MNGKRHKAFEFIKINVIGLLILPVLAMPEWIAQAQLNTQALEITADFVEKEVAANEKIGLRLSRDLEAGEGRFAVFVGITDFTSLFTVEPNSLSYAPVLIPLPAGENNLTVYLVKPDDEWKKLAEFRLKVKTETTENAAAPTVEENVQPNAETPTAETNSTKDEFKTQFTPNVSLNLKTQNLTFPRESAPERNPFTDLAGQGTINFKIARRGFSFGNQFDFAGSSFQQEALRFGELGARAPQIDLSSYLITLEKGRFSARLGHVSFGSNRHLINSFSSRGASVTIPVGKQNEISFAAVNGTSIVGFDNFVGVTRRRHSVLSATFAREFFKERPSGLRLEFSVIRGSLLPLSNFNQGEVNDAEKSVGFGFRVVGSDKRQRLRYEAGFTRSRFTNPNDAQLSQGFELTEIRPATRNARYGEISFDFLQGLKLWKEKKLKFTGTYRHEEIEPLFRSIGASTQADRRQNQFEIAASFGEINFVYGNLRDRDNLNDILSILKTFNRRNNVVFNIALNSFFTPGKPKKWLPAVSYTYDHTHQFGAFLPADGDFADLSQVPDQDSFAQAFNAVWQFSEKINLAYRYNRAFQDNRQPGRDLADFESAVNAATVSIKPFKTLGLDFELSQERLKNFEQPRIDRTFRFGTRATWETPFLKNSMLSANVSTTLAGDTRNFNDSRNVEFDAQWAYRFSFGKKKFKKLDTQFFVRYANRYGDTIDRLFFINSFNKTQTFNAGLTFNIF
jgi:hypothetical protein